MKKKYTLVNVVDVLLLLVLLVFVVITFYVNFGNGTRVDISQKEKLVVTLRVNQIPRKHEGKINSKDIVNFGSGMEKFGKVKAVNYVASSVEFIDKLTNTSSIYKSPDKTDVILSVECDASVDDDAYMINDENVSLGNVLSLSTPDYSFQATIIKIEKNEE